MYESDLSCWVTCGRKRRKGILGRVEGSMQVLEGGVGAAVFVVFLKSKARLLPENSEIKITASSDSLGYHDRIGAKEVE